MKKKKDESKVRVHFELIETLYIILIKYKNDLY